MRWSHAAEPRRRRALTLIEVVAALALLAAVLSAAVQARGRLVRGAAAADERRRAVAALDAALHDWWAGGARPGAGLGPGVADPAGEGRAGALELGGGRAWAWRSVAVNEPALARRGLRRVRIAAGPGAGADAPLIVDVLVPLARPEAPR